MSFTRESAPVKRNLAHFFFILRFQILQLPGTEGRRFNSYWEHSQFFSSEYDYVKSEIFFFEKLSVKGKITPHNICPKVCVECITKPLIFQIMVQVFLHVTPLLCSG